MVNPTTSRSTLLRFALLLAGAALIAAVLAVEHLVGSPGIGLATLMGLAVGVLVSLSALLPYWLMVRSTLVLASIAFGSITSEVGLRYRPRIGTVTAGGSLERVLFVNPVHSRISVRQLAVNGGQSTEVRFNSQGFRGPELETHTSQKRAMVFGDSFVFAASTREEDTFVTKLGDALRLGPNDDVHAINCGVSGYGPDQILNRLKGDLLQYLPDLVVVTIYAGNDFGDLLRNDLYRVSDDGQLEEIIPSRALAYYRRIHLTQHLFHLVSRHFLASRDMQPDVHSDRTPNRIQQLLRICDFEYRQHKSESARYKPPRDDYDADVGLTPESDSAIYKARLMRAVMAQIGRVATESNTEVVFVFIPSPIDACQGYAPDISRSAAEDFRKYDRATLTNVLVEIAESSNLRSVDLFPVMSGEDCHGRYFKGGDRHWNAVGQSEAAEQVSRYILETDFSS